MPELPEVETIRRDLQTKLVGHTLESAEVLWEREVAHPSVPEFRERIRGRRIEAVDRRAKYLVIRLSEGGALLAHLKMTGQMLYVPREEPANRFARAIFHLDRGMELRFSDVRKFGRLYLVEEAEMESFPKLAQLGPEPLAEAFTLPALRRLLASRRGRIKPLLMNQTFLAGMGNIYVDEALFLARIHPLRSVESLKPSEIARLHQAIREVLLQSIEHRGSSVNNYRDPAGQKGYHTVHLRVFNRTGEPCSECGREISKIRVGGRGTHFCSHCQKLPRPRTGAENMKGLHGLGRQ